MWVLWCATAFQSGTNGAKKRCRNRDGSIRNSRNKKRNEWRVHELHISASARSGGSPMRGCPSGTRTDISALARAIDSLRSLSSLAGPISGAIQCIKVPTSWRWKSCAGPVRSRGDSAKFTLLHLVASTRINTRAYVVRSSNPQRFALVSASGKVSLVSESGSTTKSGWTKVAIIATVPCFPQFCTPVGVWLTYEFLGKHSAAHRAAG